MTGDDDDESVALAREALHELIDGTGLTAALRKASSVAAIRGDLVDRAWFQFQISDLTKRDGEVMPEDFFRLRRNINDAGSLAKQR